jgi:hypothetical protein
MKNKQQTKSTPDNNKHLSAEIVIKIMDNWLENTVSNYIGFSREQNLKLLGEIEQIKLNLQFFEKLILFKIDH